MADTECGKSMRHWSWSAYKKRDALYCPNCHKIVLPAGKPGTWDFPKVGVPAWDLRQFLYIDVEVKAGNTSFSFDKLRKNQRDWAKETPERPKWIWLCMGKNAVNAKEHPRKTWVFPYERFLYWEETLNRKSLPYDFSELDLWQLEWIGDKIWVVPLFHPLRTAYHYL